MLTYTIRGNSTNTVVTFITSDYETITIPLKHPNQRKIIDVLVSQTPHDDDVITTDRLKSLLKTSQRWPEPITILHSGRDGRVLPIQSSKRRKGDHTFLVGTNASGKTTIILKTKEIADLLRNGKSFKEIAEYEQEAKPKKSEDVDSGSYGTPIGRVIPTRIPVSEANFTGYTGSYERFGASDF